MILMRGKDPRCWTPARYIDKSQKCDFCWNAIVRCKPGNTTGTRGTKAWYNAALGIWECLACRSEGMRAEEARAAIDQSKREQLELGVVA